MLLAPLAEELFPALTAELARRGGDGGDRDTFLLLAATGAALKQMLPDDAPTGALEQAAELLWQGWRFQDAGARLYVLGDALTERLLSPGYSAAAWRFAAPPACYLQLPYQRVWARVSDDAAYEPLDGIFCAARAVENGAHELSLLAVLGLRPDRPGISLLRHRAVLTDDDAAARAARPWRAGAAPFTNAIPGGELMGYRTLATVSELEARALRTLQFLDTNSAALLSRGGSAAADESALPHVLAE